MKVIIANVLMQRKLGDYAGVKTLAQELGAEYRIDPTITSKMNGDRSTTQLGLGSEDLKSVFRNPELVGKVDEFCAPPPAIDQAVLDEIPCSAGHTACYVSPYGDVYPCVQFPLPSGNLRKQKFLEIWRHSTEMNEVRSIRARDLPVCSMCLHVGACTRCPGLAYMEGNMRGRSFSAAKNLTPAPAFLLTNQLLALSDANSYGARLAGQYARPPPSHYNRETRTAQAMSQHH